ncbi:MAG: DUF4423 domain-containing protein [Bdellovibrionaceae bacterium]|nr:DUF4423 domain-containing protein [Pseudobdellovibrionaceae bacterium]
MQQDWERAFVQILKKYVAEKKKKQNGSSLRLIAQKLDLSVGALSEILREKRRISRERARKILELLPLSERENKYLLSLMGYPVSFERSVMPPETVKNILHWVDQSILGYFEFENLAVSASELALRLASTPKKMQKKINLFLRQGLLQKRPDGGIFRAKDRNWSTRETLSPPLRRQLYQDRLQLSALAIEKLPPEYQSLTHLTYAGSEKQLARLSEEVIKLCDRILLEADVGPKDKLMNLIVHAFPIDFSLADKEIDSAKTKPV